MEKKKREIKFRAKRKLNGEWVEGSLISIGNDWCHIIPLGTEYDDVRNNMIRVISETVGQSTGLLDKNKKEIFEGHIVQFGEPHFQVGKVFFDDSVAQFAIMIYIADEIVKWKLRYKNFNKSNIPTIIGNEHDNPELIKSK